MEAPRHDAELDYAPQPARAAPSERLRTARTLVVAIVVMWVVLVAAWAVDRAARQSAFGDKVQEVDETRRRLASVQDLSSVFSEVNVVVEPAVVKIDVVRVGGRGGPLGRPSPQANSGSGVIMGVDAKREMGYVVTNNHVVANANRILVTLAAGRSVEGEIVGTDPESDLAVVRIRADNLIAAEWGNSDTLRKGDWVLAFGSPFNFVGSMTAGVVSALNRTQNDGIDTPLGPDAYQNFIQVDAAVNPGNSGGPLANLRGEIIGINTAIFSRTGEFNGIGFAIPSNQARRVYEDIVKDGRFVRGWLGVSVLPVAAAPQLAERLGYDGYGGVFVDTIFRDTPAAQSALRRFDIIVSVDGQSVRDDQGLRNITAFAEIGETMTLEVFRDGETIQLPVTIGPMPDDAMMLGLQPQFDPGALGMQLTDGPEGVVQVEVVAPGSPAARAGIEPGDFILQIGDQPVRGVRQVNELLSQIDVRLGLEVVVVSGDRTYRVIIRP